MRKFSKTLAVVGLLTPMSVGALGIGEIKLRSALYENLNAEIPLVVSGDDSVSDLRINLASPEAFRRAGIDLAHFLHGLTFEVVAKPNGQFAINVSSRDPIREPFLDFLLEVSWPKGRMQREFTVLLDPPVTFQKGVAVRTARRAAPTVAAAPAAQTGSEYGPVTAGETLWSITRKVSVSGAPSRRLMQEIFENNPEAFHRGNINALKQGVTLKVPGLPIAARPAAAQTEKELTLAAPRQEGASKGKRGTATKGEIALEVADTVRQENEDIRNRLAEMEKQLASMQRMLTFKDQQLAALQAAQGGAPAPAVPAPPEAAPVPAEPKPAEVPPVAPPAEPKAVEPPPITPAPETPPAPVEQKPAEAPAAPTPPVEAPQPATPKPEVPPPPPPEEPGFLEENYTTLATGGLVLLLATGVVIAIRRRRVALLEIEEEERAPATQLTSADNRLDKGRVAGLITPSQQGSFLSEFTPSDFDVLDSDNEAIDPLSEADVYLAYGRYQQAEELIKQAIRENPFRDECKLKLLEVYYSAQNRQAFEQYAAELAADGKEADREFWARVTAMGGSLCPDSTLFGGSRPAPVRPVGATTPEAPLAPVPPAAGEMDELEIDLHVPEKESSSALTGAARFDGRLPLGVEVGAPAEVAPAVEEESTGNEIEFDLSGFGQEQEAAPPVEAGKGDTVERDALEFDLSSFDLSSLGDAKTAAPSAEPAAPPAGGLALAGDERFPSAAESAPAPVEQGKGGGITFDFGALAAAPSSGEAVPAADSGALDFKVEFEVGAPEPAEEETAGVGDLTDMDEVETKLDLARAYVDMDDKDSARRLLEEIVAEGSARQRNEANVLLAKLA